MRRSALFLVMTGILTMVPSYEALAKAPTTPQNKIEIFVAGKRYMSFKEYQMKKLRDALADVLEEESDPDLAQMQDMLNDYVKTHQTTQPLSLDPHKIKTVVINPEKSPTVK